MKQNRNSYIARCVCDGISKEFIVENVTKGRATKVAKEIAMNLTYAACVSVMSITLIS